MCERGTIGVATVQLEDAGGPIGDPVQLTCNALTRRESSSDEYPGVVRAVVSVFYAGTEVGADLIVSHCEPAETVAVGFRLRCDEPTTGEGATLSVR